MSDNERTMEENARARVLVVDGDEDVARVMVRVLGRAHDVSPLPSAEEALGRITAGERFDLILCDLALPRLTGMGFRERVGAIAPELVERIVVMTGGVSTPSADDAHLDRCGVAHLEKPFFSIEQLRAAVRDHLDRLGASPEVRRGSAPKSSATAAAAATSRSTSQFSERLTARLLAERLQRGLGRAAAPEASRMED